MQCTGRSPLLPALSGAHEDMLKIFHTVNSGLFLFDGENGLLIDAIYSEKCDFSPMPKEIIQQLLSQEGPLAQANGVLFTHFHSDHFDAELLQSFLRVRPTLQIYGPGLQKGISHVCSVPPDTFLISMAGSSILAKNTIHDGSGLRNAPHQSYLIQMGSENVFIAGDADLKQSEANTFLPYLEAPVKAVFCNPFQLFSPQGIAFFRLLAPQQVYLYHLPFESDDHYHCRELARRIMQNPPVEFPPIQILTPMAWISVQ